MSSMIANLTRLILRTILTGDGASEAGCKIHGDIMLQGGKYCIIKLAAGLDWFAIFRFSTRITAAHLTSKLTNRLLCQIC